MNPDVITLVSSGGCLMKNRLPTISVFAHTALVILVAALVHSDIASYGNLWYIFAVIDFPAFFLALLIESPICGMLGGGRIGWVYVSAVVFGVVGGAYWYFLASVIQKRMGWQG